MVCAAGGSVGVLMRKMVPSMLVFKCTHGTSLREDSNRKSSRFVGKHLPVSADFSMKTGQERSHDIMISLLCPLKMAGLTCHLK